MLAQPMSLARVVADAERYLAERGVASPRPDAEALVRHVLGLDRAGLYARREELTPQEAAGVARALARRAAGVPLQHLTGEAGFFGLSLRVRPGVFVPRPETETLVERSLELVEGIEAPRVVDVGTGTGAVALAIKARRSDALVHATDVSEEANALARENADRLGLQIEVRRGDLLVPLPGELRGRVNLVVSNPPYLDPEELDAVPVEVRADPREALVGGTAVHRRLAGEAPGWLAPGGGLTMEIGAAQGEEVAALMGDYREVAVHPDLAGRDRVVSGRWPG